LIGQHELDWKDKTIQIFKKALALEDENNTNLTFLNMVVIMCNYYIVLAVWCMNWYGYYYFLGRTVRGLVEDSHYLTVIVWWHLYYQKEIESRNYNGELYNIENSMITNWQQVYYIDVSKIVYDVSVRALNGKSF